MTHPPKSALVIGDVMLDEARQGHGRRMSSEAPVPILTGGGPAYYPGGAANVAANLAALGVPTFLVGAIGSDDYGARLQAAVTKANVNSRLVVQPGGVTTFKSRTYNDGVMVCRYDTESLPLYGRGDDDSLANLPNLISSNQIGVIALVDYNKGFLHEGNVPVIFAAAASCGVPVLVDCRPSKLHLYRNASLLKPNLGEVVAMAEATGFVHPVLAAADSPWDKAELCAMHVRRAAGIGAVAVTLGGHGAGIALHDQFLREPTRSRDRGDVVGAGDVFMASLAQQIACGQFHPHISLRFANAAAGLSIQKTGTTVVSMGQVQAALYEQGLPGSKVMSALDATRLVDESKTVVLTNGCFDGLHAGHVHLLQEAKKFGDWLVVAVNDDASIRELKGPTRPQVPEPQRLAHVAALHCVDAVVTFNGDVETLVRLVRPQVLVKGDDTPRPIKGADWVAQHNGRVEFVRIIWNFHSSALAAACAGS